MKEFLKISLFGIIMALVALIGIQSPFWEKPFLNTLYWLFCFFLIPFWMGHIFFYENVEHPKREILHKFFGWGVSFFGVFWPIGLIYSVYSVPERILNSPDASIYFHYMFAMGRNFSLFGGIVAGIIAGAIQSTYDD